MKLGLITDVHEHVEHLRLALHCFQNEQVDKVVVIGDVVALGGRLAETCQLLAEAKAIGVWGNHDFGLCFEPTEEICRSFPTSVLNFMGSLRARLDLAGCHFAHVEPWLDPDQITDLWYFDGPPDDHDKLARIFNAVPHDVLFTGHFHKWLLATPQGIAHWKGECPISLAGGRYFVVVGALCDGQFATFDTDTSMLEPWECTQGDSRIRR